VSIAGTVAVSGGGGAAAVADWTGIITADNGISGTPFVWTVHANGGWHTACAVGNPQKTGTWYYTGTNLVGRTATRQSPTGHWTLSIGPDQSYPNVINPKGTSSQSQFGIISGVYTSTKYDIEMEDGGHAQEMVYHVPSQTMVSVTGAHWIGSMVYKNLNGLFFIVETNVNP
jgi:hypothetical protein